MERKNRSSKYQWKLLETIYSNDMMEAVSNNESINYRLNPWIYNEELMDLQDQLKEEFWRIVENLLTPRQKEVIKLYSDGYNQMEIAKKLNVNQSSITKSLNGNVDYKNGKKKKIYYGGAKKKLWKIIQQDEKKKNLLDRMRELREEKL